MGKPQRSMQEWLETEIWPHIPEEELDKPPMTKAEVEEILGFGPDGVGKDFAKTDVVPA